MTLLAAQRSSPPAVELDRAVGEFSAIRALESLERILGDETPHPVGSAANARVRERLAAELRAVGLSPEESRGFACGGGGACAHVVNVLARIPASEIASQPGESTRGVPTTLLLLSHYDSTPHSPGASDDGAGVATLIEVARALLASEQPRARDVLLLFTDAEEEGLLGAEAFRADHPAMREVAAVINVEARGSSGPSMMFETGAGSGDLVRLYGATCSRPTGTSLFASIYELMPNDTDFSVMKRAGLPGLNFAYTRHIDHYHTPRDSLADLDLRSLQHHGDCILPVVQGLLRDEQTLEGTELLYFDLMGFAMIAWPLSANLALAFGAVAWVLVLARRLSAPTGGTLRQTLVMLAAWPATLASAGLAGHAAVAFLQATSGLASPWTAYPGPALASLLCSAGAAGLLALWPFCRRLGAPALWAGTWISISVVGAAAAMLFPGASYLFTAPTLVAAAAMTIAQLVAQFRPGKARAAFAAASIAGATAMSLVAIPLGLLAADSIGMALSPAVSLPIAITLFCGSPAFSGGRQNAWRLTLMSGCVTAATLLAICTALPSFTAEHPRRISLVFQQGGEAPGARWLADGLSGPLPEALASSVGFASELVSRPPTIRGYNGAYAAAAQPVAALPPVVLETDISEGSQGEIVIRLRVGSQRGAPRVGIALPPSEGPSAGLRSVSIEGHRLPPPDPRRVARNGGWRRYSCSTTPDAGLEIEIHLSAPRQPRSFEFLLFDRSIGFGDDLRASAPLTARRPEVVPVGTGDGVVLETRVRLNLPGPLP